MTFEEYCISKKIDAEKFKKEDPNLYQEWENIFDQVSPDSFTSQKKFLINPTRRRFLLTEIPVEEVQVKPVAKPAVKIPGKKPAIKIPGKS